MGNMILSVHGTLLQNTIAFFFAHDPRFYRGEVPNNTKPQLNYACSTCRCNRVSNQEPDICIGSESGELINKLATRGVGMQQATKATAKLAAVLLAVRYC